MTAMLSTPSLLFCSACGAFRASGNSCHNDLNNHILHHNNHHSNKHDDDDDYNHGNDDDGGHLDDRP